MIYEAKKLRRKGLTSSEISTKLGIPKSTVFGWIRHMDLAPKEMELVESTLRASKLRVLPGLLNAKRIKQEKLEMELRHRAEACVSSVSFSTEVKLVMLSMLYWGEGEKDTSSGVRFINSDPEMISIFLKMFRSCFNLDESKFRVMLYLHSYHVQAEEIDYWSEFTGIHRSKFHKPYVKTNNEQRKQVNYRGTASVRYGDYKLGKLLKMIYTTTSKISTL